MRLTKSRTALLAAAIGLSFGATTLVSPSASAESEREPLFEFGLVADAQYCDCDTKGTRHYRESLAKLSEAAKTFNSKDLAFTLQVGDLIDRHRESFETILPVWRQIQGPRHHVLGNHDFPVPTDEVVDILGMPHQYYDFSRDGWRFVVLDTNDISTYANPQGSPKDVRGEEVLDVLQWTGDVNAKKWNGGVGKEQMAWLESVLDDAEAAGEKVVVAGHMPVAPLDQHNAWNDAAIVETLESHDNVVAYLNGHNHAGNYHAERNGVHYLTLQGMVEQDTNAYATVRVHPDRLVVDGYGREPDRKLKFSTEGRAG